MRAMEYLQLNPLHSCVLDTAPGLWKEVTHEQRKSFGWGGWMFLLVTLFTINVVVI